MPEFLTRVRVLLVFAGLIGLALITMLSDRNESADGGSWWSRTALEIAIPLQRVVSVPVDMLREIWDRYVDLMKVREENEVLRAKLHWAREL